MPCRLPSSRWRPSLFAGKQVFRFRDSTSPTAIETGPTRCSGEAIGNYGRTVGIVGASRIGRRVIELLKPFDFKVLLFDPMLDALPTARRSARKRSISIRIDAQRGYRIAACAVAALDTAYDRCAKNFR
jgi:hypothetical protein